MNVTDSSAWLEYFTSGGQAPEVAHVIEVSDALVDSSIVHFEVGRRIWQQRGETASSQAMSALKQFRVVALNETIATRAVAVAMQHRLAMADSVIYATVQVLGATLWTQDRDF